MEEEAEKSNDLEAPMSEESGMVNNVPYEESELALFDDLDGDQESNPNNLIETVDQVWSTKLLTAQDLQENLSPDSRSSSEF